MFKKVSAAADSKITRKFKVFLSGTDITQQGLQSLLQNSDIDENQALYYLFKNCYSLSSTQFSNMAIMLLDLGASPNSIAESLDVEKMCQKEFSPLHIASSKGDVELVKRLLQSDINRGREGDVIVQASCEGHIDIVKLLMENNADINVKDEAGYTALIGACEGGHADIVKFLMENNADVNCRNEGGQNALLSSIECGYFDIAKMLVSGAKLDPDYQDDEGYTALMYKGDEKHYDVIRMLLLKYPNANINMASKCGKTALLHALDSFDFRRRNSCPVDVIRLFLKHKNIDVNKQDCKGMTALMLAVSQRREDLVKVLLAEGKADPNTTDKKSANAVFYVLSNNEKEAIKILKLLLNYGCDINCTMSRNTTALSFLLKNEIFDYDNPVPLGLLKAFLQLGADVNSQDAHGYTLLMLACLLSTGTNQFDSDTEQSANILKVVKLLLSFGANVNAVNRKGLDALMIAFTREEFPDVSVSRFDICDILLENGATVTHHLHAAIPRKLTPVIEKMIQSGAFPHLITLQKHVIPPNYFFPLESETNFTDEPLSPLFTAFLFNDVVLARKLISCNFLRMFDLYPPCNLISALEEEMDDTSDMSDSDTDDYCESDDENGGNYSRNIRMLFQQVYSQPWSLQTISLVHVSESVGFGHDRYHKISKTGLPKQLKKKLRFDQNIEISPSVSQRVYTGNEREINLYKHFEEERNTWYTLPSGLEEEMDDHQENSDTSNADTSNSDMPDSDTDDYCESDYENEGN